MTDRASLCEAAAALHAVGRGKNGGRQSALELIDPRAFRRGNGFQFGPQLGDLPTHLGIRKAGHLANLEGRNPAAVDRA
jgi:hypothetical protein